MGLIKCIREHIEEIRLQQKRRKAFVEECSNASNWKTEVRGTTTYLIHNEDKNSDYYKYCVLPLELQDVGEDRGRWTFKYEEKEEKKKIKDEPVSKETNLEEEIDEWIASLCSGEIEEC